MELKSILQLLFFLLLDRRYFVFSLGTADHARRETMLTCPSGSDLCIYLAAAGCVNLTAGDTCCIDGSGNSALGLASPRDWLTSPLGICSGGLECGTGVAASRCCEIVCSPPAQRYQYSHVVLKLDG